MIERGGEKDDGKEARRMEERKREKEHTVGHRAWRVRKNKESPLITQWGVPRNAYTSVTSLITM